LILQAFMTGERPNITEAVSVIIRHGVNRVRSGQRQTLGIIRDAR
jgi:hypothetical protein